MVTMGLVSWLESKDFPFQNNINASSFISIPKNSTVFFLRNI